MIRRLRSFGFAWAFLAATPLWAARIGDLDTISVGEQFLRFFSMQDAVLRVALLGAIFLGIGCGVLGSFIVVRRLALFGDALSHAVLPGVAIGFLVAGQKDPWAIFIGAVVAGLLGTLVVNLIKRTTHLKEDSALGMVLAGFYGVGIVLMNRIQKLPMGTQSGLDKFLFGQAAALTAQDVYMIAGVSLVAVALVFVFYRQFQVGSFDPAFARAAGLPTGLFHFILMMLLAFMVVVSLKAVGVVLVSAMLVIPAASAYLLTERLPQMMALAVVFGILSGVLGAFFSFLGNSLPTGPLMVLAASTVFAISFFFSPRHGLVSRWRKRRSGDLRILNENTLKAVYQVRERGGFAREGVLLSELVERLGESEAETRRRVGELKSVGVCELKTGERGETVYLNPEGWLRASAIVRNHRLWELYLTNQAEYEPDHVHDDAEKIEHVLGEETVRRLERLLDYPAEDPHGKGIPSLADLQRSLRPESNRGDASAYRSPEG